HRFKDKCPTHRGFHLNGNAERRDLCKRRTEPSAHLASEPARYPGQPDSRCYLCFLEYRNCISAARSHQQYFHHRYPDITHHYEYTRYFHRAHDYAADHGYEKPGASDVRRGLYVAR